MKRSIVAATVLAAGIAHAQTDPAVARLEAGLPPGWTLLATETELVIRHDRPCYATGGALVTLELRYRLEPRWDAKQLAAARATNDKIAAELVALRARYKIDAIHRVKGRPQPKDADERARQGAFDKGEAAAGARRVKLPRCAFGDASLFDDDAYRQLTLELDPPGAIAEATKVVALVKQACGAR